MSDVPGLLNIDQCLFQAHNPFYSRFSEIYRKDAAGTWRHTRRKVFSDNSRHRNLSSVSPISSRSSRLSDGQGRAKYHLRIPCFLVKKLAIFFHISYLFFPYSITRRLGFLLIDYSANCRKQNLKIAFFVRKYKAAFSSTLSWCSMQITFRCRSSFSLFLFNPLCATIFLIFVLFHLDYPGTGIYNNTYLLL